MFNKELIKPSIIIDIISSPSLKLKLQISEEYQSIKEFILSSIKNLKNVTPELLRIYILQETLIFKIFINKLSKNNLETINENL
jgi:hypothetical protein